MSTKIQKIISALMAITMLMSFAACGEEEATTTAPSTASAQEVETDTNSEDTTVEEESTEADETTKEDKTTKESKTTKKDKTTKEDKTTTAKKEDKPSKNNNKETSAKDEMPKGKAEIIKYYKNAAKKVNDKKAGFEKKRSSVAEEFEIPGAFKIIPNLDELIKGFMGMGSEAYTMKVAKGEVGALEYPDASGTKRKYYHISDVTLSESDVEKATCIKEGNNYVITLELKDGQSAAGKGVTTLNKSALDRCGICVDDKDYDFFDHKTAEIMYDAIRGTVEDTKITEETDDCKLVAKINSSTGNMVSLKVTFDLECEMTINLVGKHKVEAAGTTTVEYKNFKW